MFRTVVCLSVLFSGYQSVYSEIMDSIILSNPCVCNIYDKGSTVDYVPFSIEGCKSALEGVDGEADTVSVTLALNSKSKCCCARDEEKLSYGACRPAIQVSSSYDGSVQEGGLHALNNKVVRLSTPFTPSYLQSGYRTEKPVQPHLRQCLCT